MLWYKQSTAASLIVGPILDSTGAEYASAVIGDLSLSKNGGTLTALAAAATLTYIANGYYTLALTTGNTDTLGRAEISCNKSTYQMPPRELMVLPATVYDALVTNATNGAGGLLAATGTVSAAAGYIGATGAAVNGTDVNTLASHDPGATLGTSTLTQTQVTGGAYALNSASFAFNAALDLTTTQKASVNTEADTALTDYGALKPTTAGRTLDVSAGGEAGIDWANVGSPTTAVALTGTTIATTQQVDVNTIKTQTVTCAAGVTVGAFVGQGTAAIGVNASGHVSRVVLCDTITTYTGDTPQTGDSFARIGATGSGLTSLAPASTALSTATWTGTRAGYLDNLSGGAVALASGVNATQLGGATVTATTSVTFPAACTVATTTGAVGSVTGNVGGNVVGSVGSLTANIGGYAGGAVWFDTNGANTGTTFGVDGTAANPCNTLARALTVAAAAPTPMKKLFAATGSWITLGAALEGYDLDGGVDYLLALNGQSISGTAVRNCFGVSGTATGTDPSFFDCAIGTVTLPPCELQRCHLNDVLTVGSAGNFQLVDCSATTYGASVPTIDLGAAVGATAVSLRRWSGSLTLDNVKAGDTVTIDAVSGGTITVNGTGGTVIVNGIITVVDGSGGSVTITQTRALNTAAIATAVLAAGDVDGFTLEETLKLCLAALAAKLSGAGTTTITIRAADDSKDRITATVDASSNRTAVTLDAAG